MNVRTYHQRARHVPARCNARESRRRDFPAPGFADAMDVFRGWQAALPIERRSTEASAPPRHHESRTKSTWTRSRRASRSSQFNARSLRRFDHRSHRGATARPPAADAVPRHPKAVERQPPRTRPLTAASPSLWERLTATAKQSLIDIHHGREQIKDSMLTVDQYMHNLDFPEAPSSDSTA
jgi:hypothetical protein